jgi:hypothetical protein
VLVPSVTSSYIDVCLALPPLCGDVSKGAWEQGSLSMCMLITACILYIGKAFLLGRKSLAHI